MKLRDITDEIDIKFLHTKHPKGGRLVMSHNKKTIGALKSNGWDLLPSYSITYHPHPIVKSDDSWFTILMKEVPK